MLEPGPSPGADITRTKPFLSSLALADFRRLCVKIQCLLSLEAELHSLGFTPRLWEVGWGLLCCWQLEISICSSFLFPIQTCIIETQRSWSNVPKRWEGRTFLTTMKLLVCLVSTEAAEADLGRHFPYPHPADRYLGADGYLKSTSAAPIPTWDATWHTQTSELRDWEVCWGTFFC